MRQIFKHKYKLKTLSDEFIDSTRMYNATSMEIYMREMHPNFWENDSKELEVSENETSHQFDGKQFSFKLVGSNIVIKTKDDYFILLEKNMRNDGNIIFYHDIKDGKRKLKIKKSGKLKCLKL